MSVSAIFLRADRVERHVCLVANSFCDRRAIRFVFRSVSRLGDGWLWYVLIAAMPLLLDHHHPAIGLLISMQMLISGLCGVILYKSLKLTLVRERPFIGSLGIECVMPPLDKYSFPSGHTLHAVLFTTIACHNIPELALLLVPLTVLIAASRVILGLHYPSDVITSDG